MSTAQHIPTAFPSDEELLDAFQASTEEGHLWVCRRGRHSPRLYAQQVTPAEAGYFKWDVYPTIREAIAAGLGLIKKPSGAGR